MIVVISLNPAIDRTLVLGSAMEYEGVNYVKESYTAAGGRGVNIARAIHSLGGRCNVLGFCAGNNGRTLKDTLTSLAIGHDFTEIVGETRVNTQVVDTDGSQTHFNENGPEVTDADYLRFLEKLKLYLSPENLIVLAGRIPPGMKEKQYLRIVRTIKKSGAKLLIDSDGDTLKKVLPYKPDFIKPNSRELAAMTGQPRTFDPEKTLESIKPMIEGDEATNICASIGSKGAVFAFGQEVPLYIVASEEDLARHNASAVGNGDAMLGAIAHAFEQNMSHEEMAKFAVAMGTATAALPGTEMATMKDAYYVYENLKVYTM
ncbi:MAG: hexose kinase [Eubacteriales bacterium]|nr:hexose kinase [Eubacteriales bacterium]